MRTLDPPVALGYNFMSADYEYLYAALVDLVKASLAPYSLDNNSDVFRLTGAVWTKIGNDYSVTEGYYYYNGEVYKIEATNLNSATEIPVLTIVETVDSSEPHQTHDGNNFVGTHEIKKIRKIVPVLGLSGSGEADWNQIKEVFEADWIQPALLNNWDTDDDLGVPGTYHNFMYKKEGRKVYLRGVLHNQSTPTSPVAVTLPMEVRPQKDVCVTVCDESTLGAINLQIRADGEVRLPITESAFINGAYYFID